MAAIFDLPVTATSERVHISSAALLGPENVGIASWISSLSIIELLLFHIYFRLMAAIFDLPLIATSHSVNMSHFVFFGHEKSRFDFEIPVGTSYRSWDLRFYPCFR